MLFNSQHAVPAHGGQGGAFGNPVASDLGENDVGGISQARRLRLQASRREESGRHGQMRRRRMHRGFIRLHVDGNHAGHGARCKTGVGQCFLYQIDYLGGIRAALTPNTDN